MTALGDFVRRHRVERDLTQAELARRAGVNATYINAIETGRNRPDGPQILNALAEALGLDAHGRQALRKAAELSQRMLRLPEELSPAEHEFVRALVDELPRLGTPALDILTNVLAALRLQRTQTSVPLLGSGQGGSM
ncbi:helix-turn-helix domain-containing protein [Cupriavidus basilensis]|uniref:helix-turn-helix domain-containing protein n=1 Tax=Cupriavidus basilensis TaxID=68895 RepID=UPI00157B8CA1